jgi:anti-sigma B factor antagonist
MYRGLEYDSEVQLLGEVSVLRISGETDLQTAPQLRSDLSAAMAVAAGDPVLDLTSLEFMDSTALCLFIKAQEALREQHRSLVLAVAPGHLRRLFEITGLETSFAIEEDLDEAVQWACSRPSGRVA